MGMAALAGTDAEMRPRLLEHWSLCHGIAAITKSTVAMGNEDGSMQVRRYDSLRGGITSSM